MLLKMITNDNVSEDNDINADGQINLLDVLKFLKLLTL